MSTSPLNFSQDPDEDIANAPQYYHNFPGAAVRIRAYWTTPILRNPDLLAHSLKLIRAADTILRKYTLKLDCLPALTGAPAALRSAVRAKIYSAVPLAARSVMDRAARLAPLPFQAARWVATTAIDQMADDAADTAAEAAGLLGFDQTITIPYGESPSVDALEPVRKLIDPVAEENRLVAVFTPLGGAADGYTATFAGRLPWVLVDPRDFSDTTTLMHEIGHACRLAHQQNNLPAMEAKESARYNNLMSYENTHDRLWGWQVDTIYDSYWCTGPPPKNWWVRDARLPGGHPFLWDE
jgi:hypothetical protein